MLKFKVVILCMEHRWWWWWRVIWNFAYSPFKYTLRPKQLWNKTIIFQQCCVYVEIKQIILQVSIKSTNYVEFSLVKQFRIPILQFYWFHLIKCNLSRQYIEFIHYIFNAMRIKESVQKSLLCKECYSKCLLSNKNLRKIFCAM